MAENDDAVYDLGNAHILLADVGVADPLPADIAVFDVVTFGSDKQTLTITGTPTGGTFTLTFGADTTAGIAYNATASAVQTALEALATIDPGDVTVTGGPLPGTPVVITFTGQYAGQAVTLLTADDTNLTGGSTPEAAVVRTATALGWENAGHTSLDNDFAPFFDGGESTTRGTRQNANLRTQVATATEGVEISRVQADTDTLKSYYGGGEGVAAGRFDAPDSATPIEKAVLIVYMDGERRIAEYHPKASVVRSGAIRTAKGGWLEFPVRFTWLKVPGKAITTWYGDEITDDTP